MISSNAATTTVSAGPTCPGANNTDVTDRYGAKYTIYCNTEYPQCASDCDQINGCRGFSWFVIEGEILGTCIFWQHVGVPVWADDNGLLVSSIVSRGRVGNRTGHGTLASFSPLTNFTRSSSTSTITACAAYQTALPNNTLG